jgi:type II secretion system protein C
MSIMTSSKTSLYLKVAIFSSLLGVIITSVLSFFLPVRGVSKGAEEPFHPYESYKVGKLFVDDKKREKPKPKPKPEPKKEEKIYDMKKWKLLATYISSYTGFAIIQDGKEVETISLDYVYKGYELVEIKDDEAVFRMKGKLYSLKLQEEDKKKRKKHSKKDEKDGDAIAEKMEEAEKREESVEVEVNTDPETDEVSSATVKRDDLNFYLKNPGQIWKSVRVKDYRVDKRLRGFTVTYVKKGSVIDKLGLQKGDIITAINGEEIRSYSQVQKYYKNIGKIRSINLKILRDGEEKEIDYEIE